LPTRSRAFPSAPETAAAARAFLRETAALRLQRRLLRDALLLTTELTTNAVRHGSGAGDPIDVIVSIDDRAVRVTVRDRGSGFDPAQSQARTEDGGWGLDLVDALATRWGVDPGDGTTEVWFELDPGAPGT
jgi:anti-sigma regulatory factor (Ser/Thr protein kinase)